MKVLKVPRLPHRSSLGSSKCCTCHTKRGGVHTGQARRQASADLYESTESATPVTRIEPEELPRSHRSRLSHIVLCVDVLLMMMMMMMMMLMRMMKMMKMMMLMNDEVIE